MSRTKIYNGRLITPYRIINNGCLIIEDGKIVYVGSINNDLNADNEIDAKGNYISPGFIDIHTHGGGGHDFADGTLEAFLGAAQMHAKHGTTSIFPTTLACDNEELKVAFEVLEISRKENKNGANLLGFHLEGPYFSMEGAGAQDPKYIRDPNPEEYKKILNWTTNIARWSAAPELKGALEFGRYLTERGILPSIAHTDAVYECVEEAFENGYTHITHLYSGMTGVRRINAYRYAGVVESAYLIDEMTVEIIADGCHLPASLLKLIYKIKGPSRIALITDSIRGAGMPDGDTILGSLKNGQRAIIEDGVAKLPDRSAFAGSVATAERLVRNMIKLADAPITDAVRMMTATPASIMGIEGNKGSLEIGKDADIIVFDDDINIKMTIVNGKVVHDINRKQN